MANESKTMLTAEGLKKYEDELLELKTVRRKEVAEKIKVAREMGDLSENADYDAAKEEQTEIEKRIIELEALLKNAEVVFGHEVDNTKVNVGCSVTVLDEFGETTYKMVGSSEANSRKRMISNESPVGAALFGHSAGDVVKVDLGDNTLELKIVKVEF
ncbi:MAG: transcription elongation factor GreA [Eubacteriales bacterium]|nr:transcription elongation factor GreA [Eubacteriales bacterium]